MGRTAKPRTLRLEGVSIALIPPWEKPTAIIFRPTENCLNDLHEARVTGVPMMLVVDDENGVFTNSRMYRVQEVTVGGGRTTVVSLVRV